MEFYLLTGGEEHLMQLLWKLQSFYLKDILEEHPEPKPHQNTISTYLKILTEKKFLHTEKEGRILKYVVAVAKDDYRNFLLKNLAESYQFGSKEILQTLLDLKIIRSEDFLEFRNDPKLSTKPAKKTKKKKKDKK